MQRKKRPQNGKTEKTVEIDLFSLFCIAVIVIMGVLLFFTALRFVKSFLVVSTFEVVGECPYDASELAAGADIKRGEHLYRFDVKSAEKTLLVNCAYLEDVRIKAAFPNKIKFVVNSYEPVWYIEISGDYYALDKELNVLEETKNEQRLKDSGLIRLELPRVKSAIVDGVLTYGDGDEEIRETENIMQTLVLSRAFPIISGVDIDNRYDIHLVFDSLLSKDGAPVPIEGDFKVSLGGYSKLDVKLEYILNALEREDIEGVVGGTVDISDSGEKVSIKFDYNKQEDGTEIEDEGIGEG